MDFVDLTQLMIINFLSQEYANMLNNVLSYWMVIPLMIMFNIIQWFCEKQFEEFQQSYDQFREVYAETNNVPGPAEFGLDEWEAALMNDANLYHSLDHLIDEDDDD